MYWYKNWRSQQLDKIHKLSSRMWKVCLAASVVPVVFAVIFSEAGALLGAAILLLAAAWFWIVSRCQA